MVPNLPRFAPFVPLHNDRRGEAHGIVLGLPIMRALGLPRARMMGRPSTMPWASPRLSSWSGTNGAKRGRFGTMTARVALGGGLDGQVLGGRRCTVHRRTRQLHRLVVGSQ